MSLAGIELYNSADRMRTRKSSSLCVSLYVIAPDKAELVSEEDRGVDRIGSWELAIECACSEIWQLVFKNVLNVLIHLNV